jgi:tRNA A37 threonylcarbamoyladenosine biosynthesis protein TsaE
LENEIENKNHVLCIEWPQLAETVLPRDRTFHLDFEEKNNGRQLTFSKPSA